LDASKAISFRSWKGVFWGRGRIFGIADLNGVAGYQAGEDIVVEFVNPSPLPTDPTIDFLI